MATKIVAASSGGGVVQLCSFQFRCRRTFRIYDDDGSKNMNYEEFKEGLKDYGLDLSDEVWTAVSLHFYCLLMQK